MRTLAVAALGMILATHALAQTSAIEQSKQLLIAGKPQEARIILEDLIRLHPDPDALFLLATIAAQEGNYDRAIDLYRRILAQEPNATRVRLDLARAFYLSGEFENAEHHFRMALGDRDMPPEAIAKVERFLAEIRARKGWAASFSLALAPDTNLNNATEKRVLDINGLQFELSEDARRSSGVGIATSLGGVYIHQISDRTQIKAGGTIWRAEYTGGDFDDMILSAHTGPVFLLDRAKIGIYAVGQRRWYSNEPYSYAYGLKSEFGYRFTERLWGEVELSSMKVTYDDQPFRDGWVTTASANLTYGLSSASFVKLLAGMARDDADEPSLRNTAVQLGVGFHTEISQGFTFYVEPTISRVTYDEEDFLFGETREDTQIRIQTTIANRRINLYGFMPMIMHTYTRNWSNLDLHDYGRHQFLVGVTRQF